MSDNHEEQVSKKAWHTPELKEYTIEELTREIVANANSNCGGFCWSGSWCVGW